MFITHPRIKHLRSLPVVIIKLGKVRNKVQENVRTEPKRNRKGKT